MKIEVIHVGRTPPELNIFSERYIRRLLHFCDFKETAVRKARSLPINKTIEYEGEKLISAITGNPKIIALDESGSMMNSTQFARFIGDKHSLSNDIVFLIGGAYGLSPKVKSKAHRVLSMSKMTLQHDIALLVLLEQIYRAFTILHGQDYHK